MFVSFLVQIIGGGTNEEEGGKIAKRSPNKDHDLLNKEDYIVCQRVLWCSAAACLCEFQASS